MCKIGKNGDGLIRTGIYIVFFIMASVSFAAAEDTPQKNTPAEGKPQDSYFIHPDYQKLMPKTIAVLPMDNLSLEPEVETFLYNEVYERLKAKGYVRISVESVLETMGKLGVQSPGQISAFSPQKLGTDLNCDAILRGGIEQSASQHGGVYDAIVVSCSLYLISCSNGELLWSCEQWRAAHRQWQLDPFNALINVIAHEKGSRKDRTAWLVQEMLKTVPAGPVAVVNDNLLEQAVEVTSTPKQ